MQEANTGALEKETTTDGDDHIDNSIEEFISSDPLLENEIPKLQQAPTSVLQKVMDDELNSLEKEINSEPSRLPPQAGESGQGGSESASESEEIMTAADTLHTTITSVVSTVKEWYQRCLWGGSAGATDNATSTGSNPCMSP